MKLYATVTSERGKTIGKGGQEYLILTLGDSERNKILEVNARNGKAHIHWFNEAYKPSEPCVSMAHDLDIAEHGHCLECQRKQR